MLEGESFLLTGDANLIDLRSTVQYRVKDPVAYATNLAEPEALVRSVTRAALRSVVATQRIDALLTNARAEVEARLHELVQARLDGLHAGIALVSVRLVYVHAPQEAHDAERDVASAQEDKQRTINRAKGFAASLAATAQNDGREATALAWRRAYGRSPTTEELDAAAAFLAEQTARAAGPDRDAAGAAQAAWVDFCHALLNSNEFLYVE